MCLKPNVNIILLLVFFLSHFALVYVQMSCWETEVQVFQNQGKLTWTQAQALCRQEGKRMTVISGSEPSILKTVKKINSFFKNNTGKQVIL